MSHIFNLLPNPDAKVVCLAGEFNNWIPAPMKKLAGSFQAVVDLQPGEYQYKFVVDGQWRDDPAAAKSVTNAFGTANSVVLVN